MITTDSAFPWLVMIRFMDLLESAGDIIAAPEDPTVTGTTHLAHTTWVFADRRYEVRSYFRPEQNCWSYGLGQTVPAPTQNGFLEVRITNPPSGTQPIALPPAELVVLNSHGRCDVPWPVFRHFLDHIATDQHLSSDPPPPPTPSPDSAQSTDSASTPWIGG